MSTSTAATPADPTNLAKKAIDEHYLSNRGAFNFAYRDVWGPREHAMANPWSPNNPDGVILLRLAESNLVHGEIADFITKQLSVLPSNHLTYSTGPRGSRRLRKAVAEFLVDEFHSREPITLDDIFITPGLTSAIDAITWSICDEGDGILIPRPFYNGFNIDILHRSNARVVGVTYHDVDGYTGLDDVFCPDINRTALRSALEKAAQQGIKIRALLISNPHNPLGRCYPPETLEEFASFCSGHQLHFISDEIYAKSVFDNAAMPNQTPFVSTLALDLHRIIDPEYLHMLYGASKDFCANGLRIGCIYSKNKGLLGAISSISPFSWSPHILQDVWAAMLENRPWIRHMLQRKSRLMAVDYRTITCFLKQNNIGFYPMNAGLFLWVDLRHLFPSSSSPSTAGHEQPASSRNRSLHSKAIEDKIMELCGQNGVMIASGSLYEAEEFGWFRITFTVGGEALKEGLARILRSLEELGATDAVKADSG